MAGSLFILRARAIAGLMRSLGARGVGAFPHALRRQGEIAPGLVCFVSLAGRWGRANDQRHSKRFHARRRAGSGVEGAGARTLFAEVFAAAEKQRQMFDRVRLAAASADFCGLRIEKRVGRGAHLNGPFRSRIQLQIHCCSPSLQFGRRVRRVSRENAQS